MTLALVKTPSPAPKGEIRALPTAFPDEAALVAAAGQRHPGAARVLWDRYASLVRRLLRRSLGRQDVDDVVQESFLRLFDKVDRLRDPSRLRSFVVGVTMRVASEELRRRRVRRWLTLTWDGEVPDRVTAPADFHGAEALRRLDGILDGVSPSMRLVFVLRFVEEMPSQEVAEVLECSHATAKRRIKRAREHVERLAMADPVLARYLGGQDE